MADQKILLVEDSPDFKLAAETSLKDAGYVVRSTERGDEALRIFYSFQPDLALIDIDVPGMDGIKVCDRIRAMSNIPVIMLTGTSDIEMKLTAFSRGADDYIVKGVKMREVIARIEAVLRRAGDASHEQQPELYSDAALNIDLAKQSVAVRGVPVELTRTEYEILVVLVLHEGQPFMAEQLLHRVWGSDYNTDDLVNWHVGKLRKKIEVDPDEPELLVTRRGFGYVYIRPDA